VLREVGALKVVAVEGDRRDRFEPDLELRKVVAHFLEQRLERQLNAGRSKLQTLAKRLPGDKGEGKVLKARMKSLQTWHDQARAVLPLVRTFLKLA
jgi:DNA-binding transcriptional regulator GbsR (MarR family)